MVPMKRLCADIVLTQGVYNASKSLELVTSNSGIDAAVHLYNDDDHGSPSSLTLKTSNG